MGRRHDDGKIIVNFGEKRQILWADIQFIVGTALENIPATEGKQYAMVLIDDKWNGKLYFARKHETWKKNDYAKSQQ